MDFIAKANNLLSTITPDGLLLPEQAEELFEITIQTSTFLQLVTTNLMDAPKFQLSQMGFKGQTLFPARELVRATEAERAVATWRKRSLEVKNFKAVAVFSRESVKQVVKGGSKQDFYNFVVKGLGKAAGQRDLVDLVLNGDTSLAATSNRNILLRELNGVVKQCSTYQYNAAGQPLGPNVLDQLHLTMPKVFRKTPNMAVFTSSESVVLYKKSISGRPTALGDKQLQEAAAADYGGRPIIDEPLLPADLGGNGDQSIAFQTWPKNIWVGMHDVMEVTTEIDADTGGWKVVIWLDVDVTLEEPDGTSIATAVASK